jgi:hypothetical protein
MVFKETSEKSFHSGHKIQNIAPALAFDTFQF